MAIVGSSAQRPAGFLTFDDMLSALMGGIRDEFRSSKTDWTRLEDGSLIARGSLPIFTLEQTLAIDIETNGARTVSGLILQKLEMLPRAGQRIEFDQFDVVVEKMDGARIAADSRFSASIVRSRTTSRTDLHRGCKPYAA